MYLLLLKRNLVLSQVVWGGFLGFVKSFGSSGVLVLAGYGSQGIFAATAALNEHLDFIRIKGLCFKNNS